MVVEGWHKGWTADNNSSSIPKADIHWLTKDTLHGIFEVQEYESVSKVKKTRKLLKTKMWFYPPEPPGYIDGTLPKPDRFFTNRVFFWRPVAVWNYSFQCTREGCTTVLGRCGYNTRPRQICDMDGWYTMLTEVSV